MTNPPIAEGVVHEVPDDLRAALISNQGAIEKWNKLTALARNEWICWTTIVKKPETRLEHINRLCAEILEGKRDRVVGLAARIAIQLLKNGLNNQL